MFDNDDLQEQPINTGLFAFAGPPRAVPAGLRMYVLFGGFLSQFGWFFFGLGTLFVIQLVPRIFHTGCSNSSLSPLGLFVVLFPIVGIGVLIGVFRKGLRANHLLAYGEIGEGVLVSKEETNMEINERPVYKVMFEFITPDGQAHQAVTKTHKPEDLEQAEIQPLLYDLMQPERAVLLNDLPGRPRIDGTGNYSARTAGAILSMIIPAATVIGLLVLAGMKVFG